MSRGIETIGRVKSSIDVGSEAEARRKEVEIGECAKLSEGAATEGVGCRLPSADCTHAKSTRKRAHQQTAVKLRLDLQTSLFEADHGLTGTMNKNDPCGW